MRRPRPARPDPEKKSVRAAEPGRPDVAAARDAWRHEVLPTPAGRPVCADETAVDTQVGRRYGRGPRGERVAGRVPHGRWKTLAVAAALTAGGLAGTAVVGGPMTADVLARWAEADLVPHLRPGGVVVPDNLAAHEGRRAREVAEAAGCRLLFLPPYSPDRNPIEMAFSKPKGLLRRAAERTVPGLVEWLGWLAHCFTPTECRNDIHHSGYDATTRPKRL